MEVSMRSSSDSIAQLASALAKAQIELVNPAKTLTGVIDRWGTGNEGQTYRYAPLSAGLDIVRQALCKHELAVIQTTEIDQASGHHHARAWIGRVDVGRVAGVPRHRHDKPKAHGRSADLCAPVRALHAGRHR